MSSNSRIEVVRISDVVGAVTTKEDVDPEAHGYYRSPFDTLRIRGIDSPFDRLRANGQIVLRIAQSHPPVRRARLRIVGPPLDIRFVCIGCPLPQFGIAYSRKSSPTASTFRK